MTPCDYASEHAGTWLDGALLAELSRLRDVQSVSLFVSSEKYTENADFPSQFMENTAPLEVRWYCAAKTTILSASAGRGECVDRTELQG